MLLKVETASPAVLSTEQAIRYILEIFSQIGDMFSSNRLRHNTENDLLRTQGKSHEEFYL